MHKIYSRKWIHLPALFFMEDRNKKNKVIKIILWQFLMIISVIIIINYFSPNYEKICEDKAKMIATYIANEQSTVVIKQYNYEDLFNVEKDNNGNITMINTNVYTLNLITSDIAYNIQKAFSEEKKTKVDIPFGSFLGIKYFAGLGPNIPINVRLLGNVETAVKSDFIEKGVNQTLHKIYLNVNCNVSILTAFSSIDRTITNEVVLIENVIVGNIPSTYYKLEGINKHSEALELIE